MDKLNCLGDELSSQSNRGRVFSGPVDVVPPLELAMASCRTEARLRDFAKKERNCGISLSRVFLESFSSEFKVPIDWFPGKICPRNFPLLTQSLSHSVWGIRIKTLSALVCRETSDLWNCEVFQVLINRPTGMLSKFFIQSFKIYWTPLWGVNAREMVG